MQSYLLLRDNKQSGPFLLDELKSKGFKKYDLVWVEGKSAAWRYPGEIEELKAFAPVVEEQPFDRFFKRPSDEKKIATEEKRFVAAAETTLASQGLPGQQIALEVGNKKIYAVLPAKKSVQVQSYNELQNSKPISKSSEELLYKVENKPSENFIFNRKEEEPINIQNAVGNRYESLLRNPKASHSYRRFLQPAAFGLTVLALIGTGIFIGISITKKSEAPIATTAQPEKQNIASDKIATQNQSPSVPVSYSKPDEPKSNLSDLDNQKNNDQAAVVENKSDEKKKLNLIINEKKKTNKPKENTRIDPPKIAAQNDSAVAGYQADQSYASRQATHRTDVFVDKDYTKNNITNLVSVNANKYNVGTFGGISDVQLTVSNRSIYPLDLVMVEVQYIQANKKIFKTENIYYRNVRAGESVMQEAPKSSRGIKIQYKIAIINSKETGVSYSGI